MLRALAQHIAARRIRRLTARSVAPRKIGREAVAALPDWIAKRGWRRATRGGLRWRLNLADNLQRALFFREDYTACEVPHIVDLIRDGNIVLDIGANIGTFCLPLALQTPTARVHAFEPGSDIFDQLRRHVEINQLGDRVFVHRLAMGSKVGELELRLSPKYGRGAASARTLYGEGDVVERVPIVPLDTWMHDEGIDRIDVLKIDAEGAELDILRGARSVLTSHRPKIIVLELIDDLLARAGATIADVLALLAEHDYHPWNFRKEAFVRAEPDDLDRNPIFTPGCASPTAEESAHRAGQPATPVG